MMPEDGLDRLREFDAIYFGAVGAPDIPDDVTLWGLRLAICQGFDQYANVRPARLLRGVRSPLQGVEPGDLDWIVVRENTEGEYAGAGGRVHRGLPEEVGTELAVFTRAGCARIMRFAFELARTARRSGSPWSPSRTPSATAWCCGTRPSRRWRAASRRDDRQGAGRRHDHAHGAEAPLARRDRRDQPARRHPVRPGERAHGLARPRPDRQSRSRAPLSLDVRADPRLVRHHGQGRGEPDRELGALP